jgi:hypothetical protein
MFITILPTFVPFASKLFLEKKLKFEKLIDLMDTSA